MRLPEPDPVTIRALLARDELRPRMPSEIDEAKRVRAQIRECLYRAIEFIESWGCDVTAPPDPWLVRRPPTRA